MIDKAGAGLLPDLKRYYDIDLMETVEGRGMSPGLVLVYVRALPDESLTKALLRDEPESVGWSHDRYLLAGIFDVIRENTTLTGHWKKDPKLPTWPRPGELAAKEEKKKSVSIDDIWRRMQTGG